jgi:4'-phosphopantetheinyl transferase EntD
MKDKGCSLYGIAKRLPEAVTFGTCKIGNQVSDLFASERQLIQTAGRQRQADFSTGRLLARSLLESAGAQAVAIGKGHAGQPLWPEGFCGSISHSRDMCVAIVSRDDDYFGLGIDVEFDDIAEDALDLVLTDSEQLIFRSARLARLAFCAKEAFYKAVARHHGSLIDFHDVEIQPDFDACTFEVTATSVDPLYTRHLQGIFSNSDAATLAVCLSRRISG